MPNIPIAKEASALEDVKQIVAKNITELRLLHNMTQLELAEKLNYSDKTVSNWERAESTPDISVLVEIAELFEVSLDELVRGQTPTESVTPTVRYNRKAIAYVAESGSWIVAVLAFILISLFFKDASYQWLCFVYALPVSMIIKLVFNSIWFNPRHNYPIISVLVWSCLTAIYATFFYFGIDVALIFLLGVAGQIVIILWSFIKHKK